MVPFRPFVFLAFLLSLSHLSQISSGSPSENPTKDSVTDTDPGPGVFPPEHEVEHFIAGGHPGGGGRPVGGAESESGGAKTSGNGGENIGGSRPIPVTLGPASYRSIEYPSPNYRYTCYVPYDYNHYHLNNQSLPHYPQRVLAWDRDMKFDIHNNVEVIDIADGTTQYNISKDGARGFRISDMNGTVVLSAKDKKKAVCGFNYRYHTTMNVSYHIDTRGGSTDHWEVRLYGDAQGQFRKFKYFRGYTDNKGRIIDQTSHKTDSFDYEVAVLTSMDGVNRTYWKGINQYPNNKLAVLEVRDTTLGDHYFIGLWALVRTRWRRCHG